MAIKSYGKEYVPWDSYHSLGGVDVTGSAGFGAWTTVSASTTYGFYVTSVSSNSTRPNVVEVGYGPAGGERTVAQCLTQIPLPNPGFLIPAGSRVAVRSVENGLYGVNGIRADKWGPDPVVIGPVQTTACPMESSVAVTTTVNVTLVSVLKYPFVLTHVYSKGSAGTATVGQTIYVGASGSEVPVFTFVMGRGDNIPIGLFEVQPKVYPIPAGSRLSAKNNGSGTYNTIVMGLRLDY